MPTKYIINNEDGLITTGQTINGGISATTISADTLIISGNPIYQPSYKVYTALLTQTGTNPPVTTVLENTLGTIPVSSFISVGIFKLTFPNPFNLSKTGIQIQSSHYYSSCQSNSVDVYLGDENVIDIETFDICSNTYIAGLKNTFIEIRVYD